MDVHIPESYLSSLHGLKAGAVMAKLPDGILSGFVGKIGNIVGAKRYGEIYLRSQPNYIKDKKSPGQLAQRSKMSIISPLESTIREFTNYTYSPIATKLPKHKFMSVNMKSAIKKVDGINELDYAGLMVSFGALKNVEQPTAQRISRNEIRFTWIDNSDSSLANSGDKVLILGLYKSGRFHYPIFEIDVACRSDKEASLSIGSALEDLNFQVYICTMSKDKNMSSNSEYLGEM